MSTYTLYTVYTCIKSCRLATAYDQPDESVDLATHPSSSRVPSGLSYKTNITAMTYTSKHEEDSVKYLKSENQSLKMEIRLVCVFKMKGVS